MNADHQLPEGTLLEREQHFRFLFENMHEGYAHCRMLFENDVPHDFVYLEVNSAFGKLTGLKNVTGNKVSEVIPGIQKSNPELFQIFGRVALSGRSEKFETYVDALGIWFSIAVYSTQKEHFVAVFDNITERKKGEAALRFHEGLLQETGRIAQVGGWEFDPLTGEGTWTEEVARIHDFEPGQATNMELGLSLYTEESRIRLDAAVKKARELGESYDLELELTTAKGNHKWVRNIGHPIFENGKVVIVRGSFQDITERKRADSALRESEERFRRLIENASDMIAEIDAAGIIRYQSPSTLRMLGYTVAETTGHKLEEFIAPEDHAKVREFIRQALANQEKTTSVEFRIRHRDGSWCILQSMGRSLADVAGERRLVVNSRDITESRQLEEKFRRVQRLEAIGTLASGVAHDLNNILAPMLMAAGMLKDKLPSARDREILAMVENGAQRGASIIGQLLTFSRGIEGARVSVQLRHLLKEMEHLMRETFPRGIKIGQNIPNNLWTVLADATQMHQVFMNLCVNARDAMPQGGKLLVSAQNIQLDDELAQLHAEAKAGPYVMVTVADTGTGIPPENIQRIFDPFFTTKGIGKGTGLGLSTVIGIVKSHGGFITVYSEPGRGTAFKVYLPATGSAGSVKKEDSKSPIPVGNEELILVVDDEAPILMATRGVLTRYHYRVLTAGSGEEAIKLFIQHSASVALVLTDIMMPGIGGVQLIRSLRIIKPAIKVIATSGLEQVDNRSEFAALGVTEILSKPCMPAVLLKAVNQALEEKR